MSLVADPAFAAARAALVAARRGARPLALFDPAWQPVGIDAAWVLQRAVLAAFGPHGAWKVSGVTDAQRAAMQIDRAVGSAIPRAFCVDSAAPEATFSLSRLVSPLVECEIAFRLASDLTPRTQPWTRSEIDASVASMHLAIELVDPRLPAGSGTLAEIADGLNNGALVVGAAIPDWRSISLASRSMRLQRFDRFDGSVGETVAEGSTFAVLDGDPLAAVVQLANAQPSSGSGLRAGDVVTTGSCTGAPRLPGLGRYRASCEGLGAVEITIVA